MSRPAGPLKICEDRSRIVVIRLGAMGDCVYTFPLVSALKSQIPGADVTWIVGAEHEDMPRLHPGVGHVIGVDTKRWRRDLRAGHLGRVAEEIRAVRRSLTANPFDVALDPQGSIKSGAITWLTRAPVRVGFTGAACRERMNVVFTTHRVNPPADGHIVRKNLSLLGPLGIRIGSPEFGIRVPPGAETRIVSLLHQTGIGPGDRVVGIHPGGGHPRKRWDPGRYARVGDHLPERTGARVVLTAGPGEEALAREVAGQMRNPPAVMPSLRAGELAALLSRYDLLIAGDTGPLHLAAALGRPTVGIYGPSDPVRVAPVGEGHRILKKHCPCGWQPGLYFNRRCSDVPCLGAITVEEVVAAAASVLDARPAMVGPGQP